MNASDRSRALAAPDSYFRHPAEVLALSDCSDEEKIAMLLNWQRTLIQLQIRGSRMPTGGRSRTVHAARAALRDLFGGPVRLIPAGSGDSLLAEVALSRTVLLQAAGGRVRNGSGGRI